MSTFVVCCPVVLMCWKSLRNRFFTGAEGGEPVVTLFSDFQRGYPASTRRVRMRIDFAISGDRENDGAEQFQARRHFDGDHCSSMQVIAKPDGTACEERWGAGP
ncbi:MAG: hypothetical protein D6690_11030 [Nitrospirae bacterium]|nr:MAG: hypothetical protein D6690_11030 [Nitrospirota bacterium]